MGRLVSYVVQTSYMELIRSWEIYICSASQEMEAEVSLHYSQQATTSPYPAPDACVGTEKQSLFIVSYWTYKCNVWQKRKDFCVNSNGTYKVLTGTSFRVKQRETGH